MLEPSILLLISAVVLILSLLVFLPERGLYNLARKARVLNARVLTEDALKHIHHCEMNGRPPTVQRIAGALHITVNRTAELLREMEGRRLLYTEADTFRLSPEGRIYALRIIRAHRLWERFLADETGYTEPDWHDQAERREHLMDLAEMEALFTQLGRPTHDPHGDPIPTAEGEYIPHGGQPLTTIGLDTPARIVHLEDEPEAVYSQLVAEGLHPGMALRVLEASTQRIRFWADGDEHILAPIVAANISVVPITTESQPEWSQADRLSSLGPGESGRVINIAPAIRGLERRRLLDLGILPGTLIRAEFPSPGGDPVAYQVRGALLALRRAQADLIRIERSEEEHT